MAKQTKTTLKGHFETGDTPSQAQYVHLIDSQLNLAETGTQVAAGTISSSFLEVQNHITSSGNISSSGTIIGLSGSFTHLTNVNTTHVTASGNISSSGTGSFEHILFPQGTSRGRISWTNNWSESQFIFGKDNQITIDGDDYVNIYSDTFTKFYGGYVHARSYITTESHITSSGNLWVGSGSSANINVEGHITASGNISASGDIIGNINTTHVTASGNISSSGTITGNNLLIDGSQVDFTNLPTSDPGVAGRLFSNNIYVKISQG